MFLALVLLYFSFVQIGLGEIDADLVGTWVTKSRAVVTGPSFYDPVKDKLKEPRNTGISYSFTDDGYYEEAHYRAASNPTAPKCPKGVMQFQHGEYSKEANGSLILMPVAVDGRQMISDPCKGSRATYYIYNQTTSFQRYDVQVDPFHNVKRLNLYRFDGAPMNPMFLAYKSPRMLPTGTLNPVLDLIPEPKVKRDVVDDSNTVGHPNAFMLLTGRLNRDSLWYFGLISVSVGVITLLFSWSWCGFLRTRRGRRNSIMGNGVVLL